MEMDGQGNRRWSKPSMLCADQTAQLSLTPATVPGRCGCFRGACLTGSQKTMGNSTVIHKGCSSRSMLSLCCSCPRLPPALAFNSRLVLAEPPNQAILVHMLKCIACMKFLAADTQSKFNSLPPSKRCLFHCCIGGGQSMLFAARNPRPCVEVGGGGG